MGFGLVWARAFLLFFFSFFGIPGHLFWALERLDFPRLFCFLFCFFLEYLSIHTSDECILGLGRGGTTEFEIKSVELIFASLHMPNSTVACTDNGCAIEGSL